MSWVAFNFEKIKNSTDAIIVIERKTSTEKAFTIWIKEIRSLYIANRTYKSETKITFLPNEKRKRIVIFTWFKNQKIMLKDDIIGITYSIIINNKIEAELTATTRIIVPKGFVPSVVYQEKQCLAIVDVDEEGWLKIEPKIEIKICNLGDEVGYFNERLLELTIFTEDPCYMENLRSRIDCEITLRSTQQELLVAPAKDNSEQRITFPIEIKVDRNCLTTLSKLSSIYLKINTYTRIDRRAIFKLIISPKLKKKLLFLAEPKIEYKILDIDDILDLYLNSLKEDVMKFFAELNKLNEPIITSRTVREYKNRRDEVKIQQHNIRQEEIWEEFTIEWENIIGKEKITIIQGPMGIGKTVLSYQITRKLLKNLEKGEQQLIPLRIEGKELDPTEITENSTFWDLITKRIIKQSSKRFKIKDNKEYNTAVKPIIKKLQERYNFLVILDGYDEIISSNQGDKNLDVKSWIRKNCKNLNRNIYLLITGRPWSTNEFIPLVEDSIVKLYKMEELSTEEVERYTVESLKATGNEITKKAIEKRLSIYKKYYPSLYSRPLFLRILTLKDLEELNKPFNTFELLRDINIQAFCWTSVKFLTKIANTQEGRNLIDDYPDIQYLAKRNYRKFLETVDNKPIIKTEEGTCLTYKDLRLKIDELMEELANKIIIEPLKNGKTLSYLKLGEVETLLSTKRFYYIRGLFEKLLQEGNYWIIQRTITIAHVHIEVLFFNVYQMLEYFTISYALKAVIEKSDCKPLGILLANLNLIKGITEMLQSLINDILEADEYSHIKSDIKRCIKEQEETSKVSILPFEWNLKYVEKFNPHEYKIEISIEERSIDWGKIKTVEFSIKNVESDELLFEVASIKNTNLDLTFRKGTKPKYFKIITDKTPESSCLDVEFHIKAIIEYYNGDSIVRSDTKTIEIVCKETPIFMVISRGIEGLYITEIYENDIFLTEPVWEVYIKNKGINKGIFSHSMLQWQIFQDEQMESRIEPSPINIIEIIPNETELEPGDIKKLKIKSKINKLPPYKQYFYVKLFIDETKNNYNKYKIIYDPSKIKVNHL